MKKGIRRAVIPLAAVFGLALTGCATERQGRTTGYALADVVADTVFEATRGSERGTFGRVINRNTNHIRLAGRDIGGDIGRSNEHRPR